VIRDGRKIFEFISLRSDLKFVFKFLKLILSKGTSQRDEILNRELILLSLMRYYRGNCQLTIHSHNSDGVGVLRVLGWN
jgi:hypothetical protein